MVGWGGGDDVLVVVVNLAAVVSGDSLNFPLVL